VKKSTHRSGVSRRGFIKAVGAGAVVAAAAPAFLRAADPVVVGEGTHKYEWNSDWAKLPEGRTFGNAHMVQIAADGRVFIHHQHIRAQKDNQPSVCIFDPEGKFLDSWGLEYAGGAHGMQMRKEGNEEFLYLATTGQRSIVKTDLKGKVLWKLDGPPKENEFYSKTTKNKDGKDVLPGYSPTNIALLPGEGDIYVADGYGSAYVHQYTKDGKFVRAFGGGRSNKIGELNNPHGIFIDARSGAPLVCVADRGNHRLHYFGLDGAALHVVDKDLRKPCHMDIFGTDMLIPDLDARVTIFDKDNKAIVQLGDNPDHKKWSGNGVPQKDWKDGEFIAPHGCCYDKDGNIFITEWLSNPCGRVTKLKKLA
jgi:hypothetical protein